MSSLFLPAGRRLSGMSNASAIRNTTLWPYSCATTIAAVKSPTIGDGTPKTLPSQMAAKVSTGSTMLPSVGVPSPFGSVSTPQKNALASSDGIGTGFESSSPAMHSVAKEVPDSISTRPGAGSPQPSSSNHPPHVWSRSSRSVVR